MPLFVAIVFGVSVYPSPFRFFNMSPKLSSKLLLRVINRLEAATSRLEDMVPNVGEPGAGPNGIQPGSGKAITAAEDMDQPRSNVQVPGHVEALPPMIDDFDSTINGEVKTFVNMSEEIGGLVAEQVRGEKPLQY